MSPWDFLNDVWVGVWLLVEGLARRWRWGLAWWWEECLCLVWWKLRSVLVSTSGAKLGVYGRLSATGWANFVAVCHWRDCSDFEEGLLGFGWAL